MDTKTNIASHEAGRRTSGFLRVPGFLAPQTDAYYSRRSGLIVLDGPKGPMLAHYGGHITPDAKHHRFYANYQMDYPVFSGTRVPTETRDDVTAIAMPVDRMFERRQTLTSSNVPELGESGHSSEDVLIMPPIAAGEDTIARAGLRVGKEQAEIASPQGAGILVGKQVKVTGGIETRQPTSKGLTKESPLFGVLPKTAVTFWAADYLPDVNLINQLVQYGSVLNNMIRAVGRLASLASRIP